MRSGGQGLDPLDRPTVRAMASLADQRRRRQTRTDDLTSVLKGPRALALEAEMRQRCDVDETHAPLEELGEIGMSIVLPIHSKPQAAREGI